MGALRKSLRFPGPDASPRETLRWVRRCEIFFGVVLVVMAALPWGLWGSGWVRWLMLAVGLLSLSPRPGVARIVARADDQPRDPTTRPERARRAKRAIRVQSGGYVVTGAIIGFLVDGRVGAVVMAVFMGGVGIGAGHFALRPYRGP